jgi:hypothetical protein
MVVRSFSKWQVFGIAWLGWAFSGVIYSFCWYRWGVPPKEFIGPEAVLLLNIVAIPLVGIVCLPLPLLLSFSLNGNVRAAPGSVWVRSLVLGVIMFLLCLIWEQEKWPSTPWQFVKNLFVAIAFFVVPLFVLIRRADTNLLFNSPSIRPPYEGKAQPAIPADRPEPGSG